MAFVLFKSIKLVLILLLFFFFLLLFESISGYTNGSPGSIYVITYHHLIWIAGNQSRSIGFSKQTGILDARLVLIGKGLS